MLPNLTVPVLNRYDLLQRMLDSIDYPVQTLLLIDNGGEMPALNLPDTVQDCRILSLPSNLGVATSWNLGIKLFAEQPVFYFSSADTQYQPGALEILATAAEDEITLCEQTPHWQTFAIGWRVVEQIGLFDESFYPIYFEDTEYTARAALAEVVITKKPITVVHDNSSTINSDEHYQARNGETYIKNLDYFKDKSQRLDYTEGRWDIIRRRANSWAK